MYPHRTHTQRLKDVLQELYEPLWEELYHRSKTAGFRIRGIWIADGTHQGKSGILNKSRLQNNRKSRQSTS